MPLLILTWIYGWMVPFAIFTPDGMSARYWHWQDTVIFCSWFGVPIVLFFLAMCLDARDEHKEQKRQRHDELIRDYEQGRI